jgi:hypothetical protein
MYPDTITGAVNELRERYGTDVHVAQDGARTLVRINDVPLPPGCQPLVTDLLLVLDPSQAKPLHYVRPGQTLSNGQPVQNSSTVVLAGESWMTFSFNVPYLEGDSLARFATAVRQRFGKP